MGSSIIYIIYDSNKEGKMILSEMTSRLTGQPMFSILKKAQDMEREGKKVIHFELGDPHFETEDRVRIKALTAMVEGQTHYCPSRGTDELLEAAQKATKRSRGFKPSKEQLLVTPGANAGLFYAVAAIANPGDAILVPDPGFVSYASICNMLNIFPQPVPLLESQDFKMNDAIAEVRVTTNTKAIIINSPSNPTGAVLSKIDLYNLFKLARKYNLYVISDEIYARMIYDVDFASPSEFDKCLERVIVVNGLSKSYAMTGWRIGVTMGPELVIDKMRLMLETVQSCVSPFIQHAAAEALTGNQLYVNKMMGEYKKNRRIMVDGLNSIDNIHCNKPEGAFYCFPDITETGMKDTEFADLMLDNGVALAPGSIFGFFGRNNVRLCYATSKENIIEGIEIMRATLKERRK